MGPRYSCWICQGSLRELLKVHIYIVIKTPVSTRSETEICGSIVCRCDSGLSESWLSKHTHTHVCLVYMYTFHFPSLRVCVCVLLPLTGKGRGRQVIAVARTSDIVLMMLDAGKTPLTLINAHHHSFDIHYSPFLTYSASLVDSNKCPPPLIRYTLQSIFDIQC